MFLDFDVCGYSFSRFASRAGVELNSRQTRSNREAFKRTIVVEGFMDTKTVAPSAPNRRNRQKLARLGRMVGCFVLQKENCAYRAETQADAPHCACLSWDWFDITRSKRVDEYEVTKQQLSKTKFVASRLESMKEEGKMRCTSRVHRVPNPRYAAA